MRFAEATLLTAAPRIAADVCAVIQGRFAGARGSRKTGPHQGEPYMKKFAWLAGAVFCLGLAAVAVARNSTDDKKADKPKKIAEIMEEAHKGGRDSLRNKVVGGKGEKKDAEKLLALYVDLGKNEPPKGDKQDWKKRTDAIVAAAKDVVADKEGSKGALGKATTCATCHEAHRKSDD